MICSLYQISFVIFFTIYHIYAIFYEVSQSDVVIYSEVTAFLKKQPNIMTQYKSIHTGNSTLTLTENHLVYGRKHFAARFYLM